MITAVNESAYLVDNSAAGHAQRVSALVTAEAVGEDRKNCHHRTSTFFLAGARERAAPGLDPAGISVP